MDAKAHFETLAAITHSGGGKKNRPLAMPIVRATTFEAASAAEHRALFDGDSADFYQRLRHPTTDAAAAKLIELEEAEDGLVFGSGMGAIATSLLALLRPGDRLVAHSEVFTHTLQLIHRHLMPNGVEVEFVDTRHADEVRAALRKPTRVLYVETPSNPLLHVLPLADLGVIAREANALLVVDSTFASPYLQRPISHGAALVVHSGTKFLGGHSDVMCGVACGSREVIKPIRALQVLLGTVLDPQGAWLLLRGIKTLAVRVQRQCDSALAIARFLREHPAVQEVLYPFLEGAPGCEVARAQMRGGGGVVSFTMKGGANAARQMADSLKLIPIATSLGSVESLIEIPYDIDFSEEHTGADASREQHPALLRLSVGIEALDDLLADLSQALDRASRPPSH